MTKFYNVTHQGKFFFQFKPCTDISKLSDHFTTSDIVGKSNRHYRYEYFTFYYEDKIRSTLLEWSEKIKLDSLCTSYTNQDIRILLSEIPTGTLNDCFVPVGYRVSGSRIYNKITERIKEIQKQEAKTEEQLRQKKIKEAAPYERTQGVCFKDKGELFDCAKKIIITKYQNHIYFSANRLGSILIVKRLCTWGRSTQAVKETTA